MHGLSWHASFWSASSESSKRKCLGGFYAMFPMGMRNFQQYQMKSQTRGERSPAWPGHSNHQWVLILEQACSTCAMKSDWWFKQVDKEQTWQWPITMDSRHAKHEEQSRRLGLSPIRNVHLQQCWCSEHHSEALVKSINSLISVCSNRGSNWSCLVKPKRRVKVMWCQSVKYFGDNEGI